MKHSVSEVPAEQPLGEPVSGWTSRPLPPATAMEGRFCRLERLDPDRHGADLWEAYSADKSGRMWTYLAVGPFSEKAACDAWLRGIAPQLDPMFFTFIDRASGKALGVGSLMRIDPVNGVIETGWLTYSPALQRTPVSTEAMFLLMRRVFDELGYRRYEWKCNALNLPSRTTAERLGFTFEGVFRQAGVAKGRNRDTAWYSIIDSEWPALKRGYEMWLLPENFDAEGRQRRGLRESIATVRAGVPH